MEKYVKSEYIYYTKDTNDNLILCNFLDKTIYRYDKSISNYIIDMLNKTTYNKESDLSEKIFDNLKDRNFFISVDYDEKSIANFRYLENIMDNGLNLIIMPTYNCNFSCPYCYQDHTFEKMSDGLCEGIIKHIRKNISSYKEIHISWFGGEPLEAVDIIEKISSKIKCICENRHKAFSSSMTTNAFNLTNDVFEKLLSLNIKSYQITIDGTKQVHDKQRFTKDGAETFDTIIGNLINIKNNFKNRKFSINIRTNVSKDVLNNLDEYILFMDEKFGSDTRFSFCFKEVGNWGGESIETFKDNLLDLDATKLIYQKILDSKINHNLTLNCSIDAVNTLFNPYCYAGKKNSFVLDPNGLIGKCTCDDIEGLNNIGVFNNKGDFILNDSKVSKWIITDKYDRCDRCFMDASCESAVCAASHITERKKNDNCPSYKKNIDYILKIISLENKYIENVVI